MNTTTLTDLHLAFKAAYDRGIEYPKIHFPTFRMSRAPDTGRNKGYLYVKDLEGEYLGKVSPAGYFSSTALPTEELQELQDIISVACDDPLALLQEIGKDTQHKNRNP